MYCCMGVLSILLSSCRSGQLAPPIPPTVTPVILTASVDTALPVATSDIPPTTLPAVQQTANAAADIKTWLLDHAVPFDTTDPTQSFADLAALKPMIGDARIVALGEDTHGTHEFFQMKHRLLEYMVDELGFTSFAMETGWSEANLINDYVQTGQGDPKQLLAGLNEWPWDTQEVLDLITWMRAHNANPANGPHVSFYGFDMQAPWLAMDNVVGYLQEVNPRASAWADTRYDCLRQYRNAGSKYAAALQHTRLACRSALQAVYDMLSRRQAVFENMTSVSEYNFALQSARIPLQTERFLAGSLDMAARDEAMADNATWLLQQAGPAAKMVLWAHNLHVQGLSPDSNQSMGHFLKQNYGTQLVTVGFTFYSGAFNAVSYTALTSQALSVTVHQASVPPDDSYEHFFHATGWPRMILDLRKAQQGSPAMDWLLDRHPLREIGCCYDDSDPGVFFQPVILQGTFDIVIYFEQTSPSHLITN
jgi:erythromycin esterase